MRCIRLHCGHCGCVCDRFHPTTYPCGCQKTYSQILRAFPPTSYQFRQLLSGSQLGSRSAAETKRDVGTVSESDYGAERKLSAADATGRINNRSSSVNNRISSSLSPRPKICNTKASRSFEPQEYDYAYDAIISPARQILGCSWENSLNLAGPLSVVDAFSIDEPVYEELQEFGISTASYVVGKDQLLRDEVDCSNQYISDTSLLKSSIKNSIPRPKHKFSNISSRYHPSSSHGVKTGSSQSYCYSDIGSSQFGLTKVMISDQASHCSRYSGLSSASHRSSTPSLSSQCESSIRRRNSLNNRNSAGIRIPLQRCESLDVPLSRCHHQEQWNDPAGSKTKLKQPLTALLSTFLSRHWPSNRLPSGRSKVCASDVTSAKAG